ncbi:Retrovirus-related Pol polyprotein from transposon [Ceratobasidium sp. AG-Ba]|nr:Retrovirus-related Pol polyprotein from transposon [Ceratobasidium sp. AG-Ba]
MIKHWTGKFKGFNQGTGNYQLAEDVWKEIGRLTAEATRTIPAAFVGTLPDIALDLTLYKAEAYSFWIQYVAPILLRDRLPEPYYEHFLLMRDIVILSVQLSISSEQVDELQTFVNRWVVEYEEYYYQHEYDRLPACPLTIHALLHIPYYIRVTGPLWASWAFVMERFCGHLLPAVRNRYQPYRHLDNYVMRSAQMKVVCHTYGLPTLARSTVKWTYEGRERMSTREVMYPQFPEVILGIPIKRHVQLDVQLTNQLTKFLGVIYPQYTTGAALRERIDPQTIVSYGRFRMTDDGDRIRTASAVETTRRSTGTVRDNSFVRFTVLPDLNADNSGEDIPYEQVNYGQLIGIYYFEFITDLVANERDIYLVARIMSCRGTNHLDAALPENPLVTYHTLTTPDIFHLKTIEAVVGRIKVSGNRAATPLSVDSDSAPALVPFPSPVPTSFPHLFATPSTPTPTPRVRRTATLSDPPRPSPALVAQLSKTVLALPPTVTVTKDLRAARANLNNLPPFDDDLSPMREVEWRHKFIIATRGVTNEERAQLWADCLVFEGVAYDWYQALQAAGTTELAESKDWSTLVLRIEDRWPTPHPQVEDMLAELRDKTNPIKPHKTWAKQHLSRGRDRGSSDGDLVHDTVKKALPVWLTSLLPKRTRYGTDFAGLCKDIGELSSAEIVHAFEVNQAVRSVQGLLLSSPAPQPPPRAPTPTSLARTSSFRRTQSNTTSSSTPAPQAPIPAPSFASTQTTSRASHVAFATPLASASPSPNPDPAPSLVAEDTPDERARHNGLVAEFEAKFGVGATPNLDKPYPLSPVQRSELVARGGRATHARGHRALYHWSTVSCGSIPGTLTPGPRPVRDTAQLEEEEEIALAEAYVPENEEGQRPMRHIDFEVLDSQGNYNILLGKPWLRAAGAAQVFVKDTLIILGPDGPIELHNEHPRSALLPTDNSIDPTQPPLANTASPSLQDEPEKNETKNKRGESIPVRRSKRLRGVEVEREDETNNPFWLDSNLLDKLERWTGMEIECELEDTREERSGESISEGEVIECRREEESEDEFLDRMWHTAMQEREEIAQREILLTELYEQDAKSDLIGKLLDRAIRALERAKGPVDIQELEEREKDTRHQSAQRRVAVPPIPFSDRVQDPFRADRVTDVLNKVTIGDDLKPEQRKRVSDLVREYADIFALSLLEVLPVDFTEMRLEIPEGTSFLRRAGQKRLTKPQRQWLYKTLDDMENAKIIAKVTQDQVAAVSPTNIVPKPGGAELPSLASLRRMANEQCELYGLPILWPDVEAEGPENAKPSSETKYRLVHNFASVNKVTQLRPFPMATYRACNGKYPATARSRLWTSLQVLTQFRWPLKAFPTLGSTWMGEAAAFHDLIGSMLEVWMDDVATAADNFDEGLSNLRTIFAKSKTALFMTEARFAGARCSSEGVKPDLAKVRAILEWPEPKSALEIMSFLGCVGSFRSCIRNYARIAQPLSDLTRDVRPPQIGTPAGKHEYQKALRDAKVELTEQERKAFAELKTILTSDVVMRAPVYDGRPFTVTTDGSKFGFGAMLSQEWEVTDKHGVTCKVMYPVAFASKRTSRTKERYIPFLLKFAALKFGLDEFDNIIFSQSIIIETDCKALADLLGNKLNSTHERWRESIVARNIVAVKHRPGSENWVCDALSRMYEARPDDNTGPGAANSVDPGWEAAKGLLNDVYHLVDDTPTANLIQRFSNDPFFADILLHLLFDTGASDPITSDEERARKRRAHCAQGYMVDEGKLWLVDGKPTKLGTRVECIPSSEAKSLALAVHLAGGHFGRDMTILALQQRYFWPELRRDVIEAVTSCPRCKNFGPRLLSAQMQPITRAQPFDLIVGNYASLPTGHGGFKTVLILVDVYSRFLFAFPLKGPGTGKFTVQALDRISDMLLTPRSFMADGGSHFDCDEVREWAAGRGVQPLKTPPYAPWRLCASTVGESPEEDEDPTTTPAAWPKFLNQAVAQLNNRVVPTLQYTPRELLTGQLGAERRSQLSPDLSSTESQAVEVNMALTYSLRQDAYARALDYANKRKRAFDKKIRLVDYKAGDLVQRYDARWDETHSAARKLVPRWSGPLRVVSRALNSYTLEDLHGKTFSTAAHAQLLRPFIPRPGTALASYANGLRRARATNPTAFAPSSTDTLALPSTPRPKLRFPLEREDATQPNK